MISTVTDLGAPMNKYHRNKKHAFGLLLSMSLIGGANVAAEAQNHVIQPKKQSLAGRFFSFLAHRAYGKSTEVSAEQSPSQKYLDAFPAYSEANARAKTLGFGQVGQIKHFEIPVYRIIFLVFRKQIGVGPVSIWVQGVKNEEQNAFGIILAGANTQEDAVIDKAVFMTSDKIAGALTTDRATFKQYVVYELGKCAAPCRSRAVKSLFDPLVGSVIAKLLPGAKSKRHVKRSHTGNFLIA